MFWNFQIHQFQSIPDNDSQLSCTSFFLKAKEPNYLVPAVGQDNLSLSQCPGKNHPSYLQVQGMEAESFNLCKLGVCVNTTSSKQRVWKNISDMSDDILNLKVVNFKQQVTYIDSFFPEPTFRQLVFVDVL